MLEIRDLTKRFDGYPAVSGLSMTVGEGSVYGLVGTNGAGKSTLLRLAAGILKPEKGEILLDGERVFENPKAGQKLFFISDDAFYLPNAAAPDMETFYERFYPAFDKNRFREMIAGFGLPADRKIRTFSKGMRKQFFVAAGLAAGTAYLLMDETFDGLDPVMRKAVKGLFAEAVADRAMTAVLASHSLRELEDICDHVGLMHRGGILLSQDLDEMKQSLSKIQIVYGDAGAGPGTLPEGLMLLSDEQRGSLHTLIVRGDPEEAERFFFAGSPVFCERIPLSLEEIFIIETEAAGYDVRNIL